MSQPKQCTKCRLLNPPSAERCDCGHPLTGDAADAPEPDARPSPLPGAIDLAGSPRPSLGLPSLFYGIRAIGIPIGEAMRQAGLSDPEAPAQLLVATVTVAAASIVSALAAFLLARNRRQAIRAVQVLIAIDVLGYIGLLIGGLAIPASKLVGSILGTGIQVWILTHLLYLNRRGSLAGPALRPLGLAFWSHKYSRDQLLVISRWLLVIVAFVHEGAGLSAHASAATDEGAQDAVGMMFIGFVYLVAAVLPSMWIRIAALAIWVLDLGYTNLAMEGTSPNGLALVYMITTAVLILQMIRFRNAHEPGAVHVLIPGG